MSTRRPSRLHPRLTVRRKIRERRACAPELRVSNLLTAWNVRALLRGQLGSVRRIYLGADRVDRQDDFQSGRPLVLLLHGFFQTRNIWEVMEDRLRYDGYGVMSFNLGGLLWRYNTHPVERSATLVAEKVERLAERYGFDRVHVIGHSKGGLIARRWVQHLGGDRRVKSVVTLGTPHHGTPTAALGVALMGFGAVRSSAGDLMPRSRLVQNLARDTFPPHIPLTSVYSKVDLVCPWWASVLRPRLGESHLKNVPVPGLGHSALCWDARVYHQVRTHLDHAESLWRERAGNAPASSRLAPVAS